MATENDLNDWDDIVEEQQNDSNENVKKFEVDHSIFNPKSIFGALCTPASLGLENDDDEITHVTMDDGTHYANKQQLNQKLHSKRKKIEEIEKAINENKKMKNKGDWVQDKIKSLKREQDELNYEVGKIQEDIEQLGNKSTRITETQKNIIINTMVQRFIIAVKKQEPVEKTVDEIKRTINPHQDGKTFLQRLKTEAQKQSVQFDEKLFNFIKNIHSNALRM